MATTSRDHSLFGPRVQSERLQSHLPNACTHDCRPTHLFCRNILLTPDRLCSGGETWTPPQIHEDLPSPGCKGSLISHSGAVYWSGPYSKTRRHNLTVLASDDNGEHFTRSLQITPPAPLNATDPSAYPIPGAGYSQLQCGLPPPLDCAIVYDNGQEFNYAWPFCNLSFVRFASTDVKTDDEDLSPPSRWPPVRCHVMAHRLEVGATCKPSCSHAAK